MDSGGRSCHGAASAQDSPGRCSAWHPINPGPFASVGSTTQRKKKAPNGLRGRCQRSRISFQRLVTCAVAELVDETLRDALYAQAGVALLANSVVISRSGMAGAVERLAGFASEPRAHDDVILSYGIPGCCRLPGSFLPQSRPCSIGFSEMTEDERRQRVLKFFLWCQ